MTCAELRALTNLAMASSEVVFRIGEQVYTIYNYQLVHPKRYDEQKKMDVLDGTPVLTLTLRRSP